MTEYEEFIQALDKAIAEVEQGEILVVTRRTR